MAKTPKTKIALPSSKVDINLTPGATAAAMKAAGADNGKLHLVPVAQIKPIPGFNVRVQSADYLAHRDMLVGSIRANGFDETKPLAGYVAKEGDSTVIYVTDGYTRLDAVNTFNADPDTAEADEIAKLPVIVRSSAPSLTDLTVALHTNNTGRPLTPFELGVVVKRLLKDDGATKEGVAKRLAVTSRYLDDVLLLVNGPKEVRTAVLDDKVSSTFAIQELRAAGDKPEKAVERITAAVAKAEAKGKKRATAKDVGPKTEKVKEVVTVANGADMKEIVKAIAAHVRSLVPNAADGDDADAIKLATAEATITVIVERPAPEKPKAEKKAPAKKAPTKKQNKMSAEEALAKPAAEKPAAKKASSKKAAEPAAEAPAKKSSGKKKAAKTEAEPKQAEVTSDGLDDEPAITPPAVKSDAGVPDDDDLDI